MSTAPISKFHSKRQGTLNRFYTRARVGDLIAAELGDLSVEKLLDLGSGDGSLCSSVVRRWPGANVFTVDVDPGCSADLHRNLLNAGAGSHRHGIHDVFDPDLPTRLRAGSFDLAVCNPPFYRPNWDRRFARILQEADLADACPSTADVTAEILFLAQNLRLLRDGGILAVIVPDGFVTGWRSVPLRRALLQKHHIECVLQLPQNAFHDTDARCFILLLRKGTPQSGPVRLQRFEPKIGLSEAVFVAAEAAEQRLDYDFHSTAVDAESGVQSLRGLGADVQRGSLSTVEARKASFPVFHTTDYSHTDGFISLPTQWAPPPGLRLVVAEPGDILMARVDRRLHEKVGIVVSGTAALSDCVYRVRLPPEAQCSALNALRSPQGAARLQAISKGVSARLLGKGDLLDLPLI